MFSEDDLKQGEATPVLGPAYFDARRVAEQVMSRFEVEHFKPLIEKAAQDFEDRLWTDLQASLLSDTEMNLQGEIWRMVDGCVNALLTGDRWALERFALGSRYEHDKVRAAVAKHITAELQDKRVADLEAELAMTKHHLECARR